MTETSSQGKTFFVAVRLYEPDMVANQLSFRGAMPKAAPTSSLFPSAGQPPSPKASSPATRSIPPAPNKVHVNEVLETKRFTTPDIPSLSNTADIQRWYNVLHSRALVCGIYTHPWKSFTKASPMGVTWSLVCLTPTVMGRVGLISAALHALLSREAIFKGPCTALAHLVSCTDGDGYLALFQLVRMVHPALGQATAQREHPSQLRSQPFAAHISRFIDYYQSEECSGRFYSDNEKVISIISRLHPTWCETMKRKYINIVPQFGTIS
jgi:hypothetical protein